ncbi:MAG TPA: GNAT family N-acetyltransferase [Pirellulales bacterium]|nr:GNAT family N-acetyltransferase [Pirellulales bacterium]
MTPIIEPSEIVIRSAVPEAWTDALKLLFQGLPEDMRGRQLEASLDQFRAEPITAAGLLEALSNDSRVGAVWLQLQVGRVANLWPPQAAANAGSQADAVAQKLLTATIELAVRAKSRMIQALLPTDAEREAGRLRTAGFEHIADLLYLVSPASSFPSDAPSDGLEFESFSAGSVARFEAVVERTYLATCDCPRMNGVRPIQEVLEGYRGVGQFDPANWLLVRHGARDVGCLLLANHAEHQLWELVYMGIVPEARGEGFGVAATRHAQWLAGQAGAERLVLAVDAANEPALRGYAAAGFVGWDRRNVWLKRLA